MRLVIALGGNALLRRGETLSLDNQRANTRLAVQALAPLAQQHELVLTHGNGPQVGWLSRQSANEFPLDMLDAETEGMLGYLIQQELGNALPAGKQCVTLLTQVEVDPQDAAFAAPAKPVGAVMPEGEAKDLARRHGWHIAQESGGWRRVVASPLPRRIIELETIRLLLQQGVIVICAGGGGIPVMRRLDGGLAGVEAVVDKDLASACLARELQADALLLLTDVAAVYDAWDTPQAQPLRQVTPQTLRAMHFAPGSMAPKVAAACEFVEQTGGLAGIGRLQDATEILAGRAGTRIAQ